MSTRTQTLCTFGPSSTSFIIQHSFSLFIVIVFSFILYFKLYRHSEKNHAYIGWFGLVWSSLGIVSFRKIVCFLRYSAFIYCFADFFFFWIYIIFSSSMPAWLHFSAVRFVHFWMGVTWVLECILEQSKNFVSFVIIIVLWTSFKILLSSLFLT